MSDGSAARADPEYDDIAEHQCQRQRQAQEDAKVAVVRRIEAIVRRQFMDEMRNKEKEIDAIDTNLHEARRMLDRLRTCAVAKYYNKAAISPLTGRPVQPLPSDAPSIHPAVKQHLGKCPRVHDVDTAATTPPAAVVNTAPAATGTPDVTTATEPTCGAARLNTDARRNVEQWQASGEAEQGRRSRFKVKKRIVVGNVSKYIPVDKREGNDQATHKWMAYVRGSREKPEIHQFVSKVWFFLHPSYRPNDLVEVTAPPFHLMRRGWGEFPLRVQLFFHDTRNKRVDIIHLLRLDKSYTGLQTLGGETVVDIEIERESLPLARPTPSTPSTPTEAKICSTPNSSPRKRRAEEASPHDGELDEPWPSLTIKLEPTSPTPGECGSGPGGAPGGTEPPPVVGPGGDCPLPGSPPCKRPRVEHASSAGCCEANRSVLSGAALHLPPSLTAAAARPLPSKTTQSTVQSAATRVGEAVSPATTPTARVGEAVNPAAPKIFVKCVDASGKVYLIPQHMVSKMPGGSPPSQGKSAVCSRPIVLSPGRPPGLACLPSLAPPSTPSPPRTLIRTTLVRSPAGMRLRASAAVQGAVTPADSALASVTPSAPSDTAVSPVVRTQIVKSQIQTESLGKRWPLIKTPLTVQTLTSPPLRTSLVRVPAAVRPQSSIPGSTLAPSVLLLPSHLHSSQPSASPSALHISPVSAALSSPGPFTAPLTSLISATPAPIPPHSVDSLPARCSVVTTVSSQLSFPAMSLSADILSSPIGGLSALAVAASLVEPAAIKNKQIKQGFAKPQGFDVTKQSCIIKSQPSIIVAPCSSLNPQNTHSTIDSFSNKTSLWTVASEGDNSIQPFTKCSSVTKSISYPPSTKSPHVLFSYQNFLKNTQPSSRISDDTLSESTNKVSVSLLSGNRFLHTKDPGLPTLQVSSRGADATLPRLKSPQPQVITPQLSGSPIVPQGGVETLRSPRAATVSLPAVITTPSAASTTLSVARTALPVAPTTLLVARTTFSVAPTTFSVASPTLSVARTTLSVASPTLSVARTTLSVASTTVQVASTTLSARSTALSVTPSTFLLAPTTLSAASTTLSVASTTSSSTSTILLAAPMTLPSATTTLSAATMTLSAASSTLSGASSFTVAPALSATTTLSSGFQDSNSMKMTSLLSSATVHHRTSRCASLNIARGSGCVAPAAALRGPHSQSHGSPAASTSHCVGSAGVSILRPSLCADVRPAPSATVITLGTCVLPGEPLLSHAKSVLPARPTTANCSSSVRTSLHNIHKNRTNKAKRVILGLSDVVHHDRLNKPHKSVLGSSGMMDTERSDKPKKIILDSSGSLSDQEAIIAADLIDETYDLADYLTMSELIDAVVKRHPLVGHVTNRARHSYSAPSREVYLGWPLAKRRAHEWMRARAVLKTCCATIDKHKETSRWHTSAEPDIMTSASCATSSDVVTSSSCVTTRWRHTLWRTKQVVVWCRAHGYSPLDGEMCARLSREVRPLHSAGIRLSTYTPSRALLQRVRHDADTRARDNDCDAELDVITYSSDSEPECMEVECSWKSPSPVKRHYLETHALPASPEAQYVEGVAAQLGVCLRHTELERRDGVAVTSCVVHAMLWRAARALMDELVRGALSVVHDEGRVPDEVSVADVHKAITRSDVMDVLSNQGLGVEEGGVD